MVPCPFEENFYVLLKFQVFESFPNNPDDFELVEIQFTNRNDMFQAIESNNFKITFEQNVTSGVDVGIRELQLKACLHLRKFNK